jgi:hypothetical protein
MERRAEGVASCDIFGHQRAAVPNSSRNKRAKNLFFLQPR